MKFNYFVEDDNGNSEKKITINGEMIKFPNGSGAKIFGLRKLNKKFLTELNFMLLNQRFHR